MAARDPLESNGNLQQQCFWDNYQINCISSQDSKDTLELEIKVRLTQKMLVKLSHHHSSEHFFAPGLLIPVNGMNSSDKVSIFSFFCINQINLLKLIQICTHVVIDNFVALQAL